jgi:hypothetical protein
MLLNWWMLPANRSSSLVTVTDSLGSCPSRFSALTKGKDRTKVRVKVISCFIATKDSIIVG